MDFEAAKTQIEALGFHLIAQKCLGNGMVQYDATDYSVLVKSDICHDPNQAISSLFEKVALTAAT